MWTLAAHGIFASSQWLTFVLLAKLLAPDALGSYAFALAITAPVFVFANLKLRSVVASDARADYTVGEYIATRITTTGIALVAVAAIASTASTPGTAALLVFAVAAAKGADSLAELYQAIAQRENRLDLAALPTIANGVGTITAMAAIVYLTRDIVLGAVGSVAVSAGALALSRWAASHSRPPSLSPSGWLQPTWNWPGIRSIMLMTLPLGLSTVVGSLNVNIPRYAIESYLGLHQLGVYSGLAAIVTALGLLINALGQSATPQLSRLYASGDYKGFRTLLGKLLGAGAVIGLGGIVIVSLAGRELVSFLYTPEYSTDLGVLVLLMVAAALTFSYVFLGTAVTAMRQFRVQLPIAALTLGLQVAATPPLVRHYGLRGAAIAVIVSAVVQAIAYLWIVVKRIPRAG